MKRIWFSLMAFGAVYTALAQVTITQKKAGMPAGSPEVKVMAVSDTGILLKLEADTASGGGALLLPRLTDEQKEAMMGGNLPEGMLIYDKDKHRLELFVEKKGGENKEGEWKPLGTGADSDSACAWVQITATEAGWNGGTGTADAKKELTLTITDKKPCIRNKGTLEVETAGAGTSGTTMGKPGAKLVYQGLTLNPNTDYDINITNNKVKITFKTLVPESFNDFDVFMVAYRS